MSCSRAPDPSCLPQELQHGNNAKYTLLLFQEGFSVDKCCNFSLFPSTIPLPWFNTHPFVSSEIIWTNAILELIPSKSFAVWPHLGLTVDWFSSSFFFFPSLQSSPLIIPAVKTKINKSSCPRFPLWAAVYWLLKMSQSVPAYCMAWITTIENQTSLLIHLKEHTQKRQFCPLIQNHTESQQQNLIHKNNTSNCSSLWECFLGKLAFCPTSSQTHAMLASSCRIPKLFYASSKSKFLH